MSRRRALLGLGLAAVVLAGFVQLLASEAPDGLERVALDLGFADREQEGLAAPMPGYELPGGGVAGRAAAGLVGAALAGVLAMGAGRLAARRDRS